MKDISNDAQGFFRLYNFEEHEKAVKAYKNSLKREEEWKQLVAEGKATCTKTPVIGGFRYHYELIDTYKYEPITEISLS